MAASCSAMGKTALPCHYLAPQNNVGGGGRPYKAMDKLQGPIAAWLRKLSPSETLSERTFEPLRLAIA